MSSAERAHLEGIEAGAQVNKLEGVQVDGTDLSISGKKVNINLATPIADAVSAAKGELNGTITGVDNRLKAVEDDYLKAADKTEINGTISALDGRVAANEGAIEKLNGEGEGSVKKAVADAVAGVVASAPEDFDTLKEVADWIASDTTGAAKMQADIARLDGADTVDGSVKKQIKDAVAAEAEIARAAEKANSDAIATEKGRVDGIVADYLKAADKTELQGSIDGLRTDLGNKGDAANSEGSAFARIAKVAADLSALQGEGGSVASQISAAITGYDTATVQPLAGKVTANEQKLAGISEGANKTTMVVEGETLKVTIA
jgi:hypothetical protein